LSNAKQVKLEQQLHAALFVAEDLRQRNFIAKSEAGEELQAQVVQLTADLAERDERLVATESDAAADKSKLAERYQQLEEAGRRLSDATEQLHLRTDLLATKESVVAEMEESLARVTAACRLAMDSNQQLEARTADLEEELEVEKGAVATLLEEHAELARELDAAKAEAVALELLARRQAASAKELDETSDTKKQLKDQLFGLEQLLADSKEEYALTGEEAAIKSEALEAALAHMSGKLTAAESISAERRTESNLLEANIVGLERELQKATTQSMQAAFKQDADAVLVEDLSAANVRLSKLRAEFTAIEIDAAADKSKLVERDQLLEEASRRFSDASETASEQLRLKTNLLAIQESVIAEMEESLARVTAACRLAMDSNQKLESIAPSVVNLRAELSAAMATLRDDKASLDEELRQRDCALAETVERIAELEKTLAQLRADKVRCVLRILSFTLPFCNVIFTTTGGTCGGRAYSTKGASSYARRGE
jgi:chromosome segregation ATPase